MNKKERSERTQNRTDATFSGRSMVEMLGVLAIIGVLSVGAISGYSKAMLKYKLNKQAGQLTTVFNAAAQYAGQFTFSNSSNNNITSTFIKLNLIPTEMADSQTANYIYDVFKNRMYIAVVGNNYVTVNGNTNYQNAVFVEVQLNNNDNSNNVEICRNTINAAKENDDILWYLETFAGTVGVDQKQTTYRGPNYCSGNNCISNLTFTKIDDMCRGFTEEADSFTFRLWFK